MPVSIALINFGQEANIAFAIRSAACFGVKNVYIIGNTSIKRETMQDLSGSTLDLVDIKTFSTPMEFVEFARDNKIQLVSMELPPEGFEGENFNNIKFDFQNQICLSVGHETAGTPIEILKNSKITWIPMPGKGFCLNTSQTINIGLFEAAKQYAESLHKM